MNLVPSKITHLPNEMLLAEVNEKEVKMALFNMHPYKSPVPNGMSPCFYQYCCNILKDNIVSVAQKFFKTGVIEDQLRKTNIALIPKKINPVVMTDIRHISLCNVINKVISKVLANRMKKNINYLVSKSQSAFFPGHLITDNIMIASKVMHYIKWRTKGRECWMALKLDMSKFYDRVEWIYMEALLLQLGLIIK